jgi:4-amino-4-deoxychorismate lyase
MKLIESIKVEDGIVYNEAYHIRRMQHSVEELLGINKEFHLPEIEKKEGLYKLRIIYEAEIDSYTLENYEPKKIQKIHIVHDNNINYAYKFKNRHCITKHNAHLPNNEEIIIVKNDLVTDSSYSNLVFFDGDNYFTPLNPLLKGTKRQQLLDENKIIEKEILIKELYNFKTIFFINALNDLGESSFSLIEK